MSQHNDFILTLSCPDQKGIVYSVTGFLFERGCNILDSAQFGDEDTGLFFMRVHFDLPQELSIEQVVHGFEGIKTRFEMQCDFHHARTPSRLMLLVSQQGHCLNDLLFRYQNKQLNAQVACIVSNHTDFAPLATSYGIDFHHLPITAQTKTEQETRLLELIKRYQIDLVVLARYMQVLSASLCSQLAGRVINIHHSFLPSFKGAKPYAQAHDRGVKLIGATAHYVTPDLDEGPIIEQDVARVDHSMSVPELTAAGSDIESLVLARAVRWHTEHRVLMNGHRTVIFK